ncbi:hypothetical protein BDN72DRAFT_838382 [Pluteus cervinus]|uniref:Uncharacterized protein n=1 Tax=Pluteus cervinus TaxID=181527 RepID=A0ACD3AYG5_9AGAR|nr:hypothetical protein BDN72DRAFT_838382 [Pluteus cervinus]
MPLDNKTTSSRPEEITSVIHQSIPVEISDLIIDHCRGRFSSLKTCSTVSRAWGLRARFHIFKTIHLRFENFESFLYLLDKSRAAEPNVRFRGPAEIVQHLILEEGAYSPNEWVDKAISSLTAHLAPNITNLTILDFNFTTPTSHEGEAQAAPLPLPFTLQCPGAFERITHLRLEAPIFLSYEEFVGFLCSFPLLQSLFLGLERHSATTRIFPGFDQQKIRQHKLPLSVRRLGLNLKDQMIFPWLFDQPCLDNIDRLEVFFKDTSLLIPISKLLKRVGTSLRDLYISFPIEGPYPESADDDPSTPKFKFTLAHNPKLRRLSFPGIVLDNQSAFTWLPELLSTTLIVTSPDSLPSYSPIEELQFYLFVSPMNLLATCWPWTEFHELLKSPSPSGSRSFTGLKRITFIVDPLINGTDKVSSRVRKRLPILDGEGVLWFREGKYRVQYERKSHSS